MTFQLMLRGRMAAALDSEPAAAAVARRVCQVVLRVLDADGAALTLESSAPYRIPVHATDGCADSLEDLQDVLREGPGMDAFDTGEAVEAALGGQAETRWPSFVPAAARLIGRDSMLWGIPMRSAGQSIGAVTAYRHRPEPAGAQVLDAQLLADVAAGTLLRDPSASQAVAEPDTGDCWSARAAVHQATGMLAAQSGAAPEDALTVLREYAFASGRRLSEVAGEVIAGRLRLSRFLDS